MMKNISFLIYCLVFWMALPAFCMADASPQLVPLSTELNESLVYLLSFADRSRQAPVDFNPHRIENVVDFVLAPKADTVRYQPGKIRGTPSAFIEAILSVSLRHVLDLAYNPQIPSVLTSPSSIRMAQWRQINGRPQPLPDLKNMLDNLQTPVILSGIEYMENTPDTFSGAYYDYELDRTIILYRHADRTTFISIAAQKGTSNVGKKGIILGADQNWDFLYTGQPGNNLTGLNWAKTYMYDSFSVTVYCETDAKDPMVNIGLFKWVRAGWADINLVRTDHIYSGLQRFIQSYKQILESPNLTDVAALERTCGLIDQLSSDRLRQMTRAYFKNLAVYYAGTSDTARRRIDSVLKIPDYIEKLSRLEMQSLLFTEYAKKLLGKKYHTELTYLLKTELTRQ